ncbi:MAG: AmiS/UreI family transporter [Desulfurella sp.]|uniref:AmiS/UreI family transporter n=1 Tax=Desulfurella sp. TaxID=1962857 RepID=UPI003D0E829D
MSQKGLLSKSFLTSVMCFLFFLTLFCNAYAANQTQIAVGKWIAPIIYLGAFALLSQGFMHLDPERKKANEKTVGVITLVVGVMWWPFLIAMISNEGLGPITNFVAGLAGMYAFFFMVLGILEIFSLPKKSLGGIAILIGWLTLAYALFWLLNGLKVSWAYHASIAFVWFVAMNLAGLLMQGKMNEKLVGWVVTFAALYTFAIPAILWSLPAGMQGPF